MAIHFLFLYNHIRNYEIQKQMEESKMKTTYKILISGIATLLIMWGCYQIFHLETIMTSIVGIITMNSIYSICSKVRTGKGKEICHF